MRCFQVGEFGAYLQGPSHVALETVKECASPREIERESERYVSEWEFCDCFPQQVTAASKRPTRQVATPRVQVVWVVGVVVMVVVV